MSLTINKVCIKENTHHLESNQIIHDIYIATCQLVMGMHFENAVLVDLGVVQIP